MATVYGLSNCTNRDDLEYKTKLSLSYYNDVRQVAAPDGPQTTSV